MTEGKKSVPPAARKQGVDPAVVPVIGVHHVCVLQAVEIERLLREPADQSRLEEGRPHVLEEPFRSAFIHLCVDAGGKYVVTEPTSCSVTITSFLFTEICL